MRLLIDGYNLLHATDLFGTGELKGTLRGSREALIGFLAERLSPAERRETVVVFDATDAPQGLADSYNHGGIDIRFARDFPDADAMIEALLADLHRAKHLTVVSGDRRVQRAARSSGAGWINSSEWFRDLCHRNRPTEKADPNLSHGVAQGNDDWISEFSDPAALAEIEKEAASAPLPKPPTTSDRATSDPNASEQPPAAPRPRRKKRRPPLSDSGDKPSTGFAEGISNPFPDGYADDLLEGGRRPDGRDDRTGESDQK